MIFFVLGSQAELAMAEIRAVLEKKLSAVATSSSILLAQDSDEIVGDLQNRLAGVVKIGRVVGEMSRWDAQEAAELVASFAMQAAGKNKISFGLSVYDLDDARRTREIEKELDRVGLIVKRLLKEGARPVRYVKAKEPRLSSAVIDMNGLLASGGEFVLLVANDRVYVGQTETIQDFRAWEERDFGRPARDAKSGMLPPKLARLMINLSGIDPAGATILDPFCGSGTILMEAALMGFHRFVGSDISEKAIEDTAANLTWLVDRFKLTQPKLALHTSPAAQLKTDPVDLLVTEVYLGAPRHSPASPHEIQKLESELLPTYRESFTNLKRLLKPSARAVVAFPAYKKNDGAWHRLPLEKMLSELDYRVLEQYLYHRPDQLIGRDIYVLTRK